MCLEWWMLAVMAVWWFLSVRHISNSAARNAFNEGTNTGIESALKILEQRNIIRVDDDTGEIEGLPKNN